jgi:hypothetical protein
MARKTKAEMIQEGSSVHDHQAASGKHATKAAGEQHTKTKGHLMEGIVAGLPKRNLPVVIDGICRGISKHNAMSLSADTMHVKGSATKDEQASFGSGLFPQGKTGK